jgi:hypothetical protein
MVLVLGPTVPLSILGQRGAADRTDFFSQIGPQAGNGETERVIVRDVASYGRQLGWITEVLLSQAGVQEIPPDEATKSLKKLQGAYHAVEAVKGRSKLARSAAAALEELKRSNPAEFAQLLARFAGQPPALLTHQPESKQ